MRGARHVVAFRDGGETARAFSHHAMEDQPGYEEGGVFGRLVVGRAFGAQTAAPVRSPMC